MKNGINSVGGNEDAQDASLVIKAGLWYTISNFLFRGAAFITTPLFTRLLTKQEFGAYNNFASWVAILTIITAFDAHTSIIRSKHDVKEDLDSYIYSILTLNSLVTLCCYVCILIFKPFFLRVFGFQEEYIHIMFVYLFVSPAFNMLLTRSRAFYKYKLFALLSGISTLGAMGLSVVLVISMQNKLLGRVLGQYIPISIISLVLYGIIIIHGKKIRIKYWKYVVVLCVPLIPHLLSINILGTSARIMINNICGPEFTALYSIAYSCQQIASIIFDSINKAWAPWLLDSMHSKNYDSIKKASKPYFLIMALVICATLLVGPEIVWILGGESYMSAVNALPPLLISCAFQCVYTMYVNVEFYCKRTIPIAIATMVAAAINIALNYMLIPIWGYVAAAYATLIGYICMLVFHYITVKRLGFEKIFDRKFIFIGLAAGLVFMSLCYVLYQYNTLRYVVILIYGLGIVIMGIKYRKDILMLIKGRNL